jgi:adenine-specific DNA-methyltransferase
VRLLDPGAGIGSLSAAWVARMCARTSPPRELSVVAYEVDPHLIDDLHTTLAACKVHCARAGIAFASTVRHEDFIAAGAGALRGGLFPVTSETFDCTILNPPYRKIHTDSQARRLLETIGVEATNLYVAFLWIAAGLLKPGGELVAITPRSFCNGPYFRSFRKRFLDVLALRRIHSFERRDRAFSDDEVLQENVVLHGAKTPARQGPVVVSSSAGPEDDCPVWHEVAFDRVVRPADSERFIHIPADGLSEALAARMEQFRTPLHELGLEVSTGRVVDFRVSEALRDRPGPGTVPLIYPGHMLAGYVAWPRNGGKKPNALAVSDATEDLLVPRGFYVLVKRFSSKEERRRIVAAVCDPAHLPESDVAFENHLNYFHARGRPLTQDLARGLTAFLNSTLVDCHFREWSGHTQVNASDLRRLLYPTRARLEALGAAIGDSFPDQDEIDRHLEEDLLDMPSLKKSPDPIRAKKRVREALAILKALGFPKGQQNERSALSLLALLDVKPKSQWADARNPLRGITQMMKFFEQHYGKAYAPNSRETVRRQTVHQFVQAGLAVVNPDNPARPTNSGQTVYQIAPGALALLKSSGTPAWAPALKTYLTSVDTLQRRYAQEREMQRIPLALPSGKAITLTPGGQNVLVKRIIDDFCPLFTPGAKLLYVGDTGEKFAYFDTEALSVLGVELDTHGKMPDVVVHDEARGWLVLIEAVTTHGPVDPKRRFELQQLFKDAQAGCVYVTAFMTRKALVAYLNEIAWETEVWVAESPTHLIHFNGERFLGPA